MTTEIESELGGGRIGRLDGIRTIAVLAVFAFHTGFLNDGWIGVHLFFVLSGFLITGILRRARTEPHFWGPFYIKRAARILPPLVIIFVAAAVMYNVMPWHKVGLLDLFFLGNVSQTLYPRKDANLGVLWSLAVEEHFYLLWPFAIRFLDRRRIMQILVAILILEPILRAAATPFVSSYIPIYNLTPFQLDGLAAGSLLALLFENKSNLQPLKKWSGWSALISLLLLQGLYRLPFFHDESNSFAFNSLGYTLVVFLSASFVTYVLVRPDAWIVRQVARPSVVFVGTISYGMYLFNPIPLSLAIRFVHRHGIHHDKAAVPFALALTILMAWLSFRFYETPIIKWGRQKAKAYERSNHPLPLSPLVNASQD